jgi:hypothetical protein
MARARYDGDSRRHEGTGEDHEASWPTDVVFFVSLVIS